MKILVQWARRNPKGWEELDSSKWVATTRQPPPEEDHKLRDVPGWVYRLNVQGIEFQAQYIAVEHLGTRSLFQRLTGRSGPSGCKVYAWFDGPTVRNRRLSWAEVWTFTEPAIQSGPSYTREGFAYSRGKPYLRNRGFQDVEIKTWNEFHPPAETLRRSGMELFAEVEDRHRDAALPVSWQDWLKNKPKPVHPKPTKPGKPSRWEGDRR